VQFLQTRARAAAHAAWLALACTVFSVAAHADRAYVSNEDERTVSVVDTQQAAVIATIEVGKRPRGIKLSHDGSRLFVAVSGLPKCPPSVPDEECAKLEHDIKADGIAIIDTASKRVIRVLAAGSDPEKFDLSADGRRLFVSNEDSATASVVDIESGKVISRIAVGREPEGVTVSPNGRWLLVTSETDDAVSIIDTATLKVLKTVHVGHRPRDAAFTPDSRTAYVSGEVDASLYRISVPDGNSVERVFSFRKEARPMGVLVDAPRNRLFVSTGRGGTVAVIDTAASPIKLLGEVKVGARPWGIALSADGSTLYSANGSSNTLSIIDVAGMKVSTQVAVGHSPWGVAVGPDPRAAAP